MIAGQSSAVEGAVVDDYGVVVRRVHPPTRVIAIAATPRTGSTLLARGLEASGLFATSIEHANPYHLAWELGGLHKARLRLRLATADSIVARAGPQRVEQTLRRVAAEKQTSDGTFGLKIMWAHYELYFLDHNLDVGMFGAPVSWIRIRRRDYVRQAVSILRAEQTDRWSADERLRFNRVRTTPRYDGARLRELVDREAEREKKWDGYFGANGLRPFEVTYEDLDADYEGTMRAVLDHLGAIGADVPPRQLQRQSDELNEEWVRRFRAEMSGPSDP